MNRPKKTPLFEAQTGTYEAQDRFIAQRARGRPLCLRRLQSCRFAVAPEANKYQPPRPGNIHTANLHAPRAHFVARLPLATRRQLTNHDRRRRRRGHHLPVRLAIPPPAPPSKPAPRRLRPPALRHQLVVVVLGGARGGAVAPRGAEVAAGRAALAARGVPVARRARGPARRGRRAAAPPPRARGDSSPAPRGRRRRRGLARAPCRGARSAAQGGARGGGRGRGEEGGGAGRGEEDGGGGQGRASWDRRRQEQEDAESRGRGRGRARDAGERRRGPLVLARIRLCMTCVSRWVRELSRHNLTYRCSAIPLLGLSAEPILLGSNALSCNIFL